MADEDHSNIEFDEVIDQRVSTDLSKYLLSSETSKLIVDELHANGALNLITAHHPQTNHTPTTQQSAALHPSL